MIARLQGIINKSAPGDAIVDVNGVGYAVRFPVPVWDELIEGSKKVVWTSTYVREDRLELFGFLTEGDRILFEELIEKPGIGPKLALELCAVPRSILLSAVADQDAAHLQTIKGVGKKKAETILLDIKTLLEKHPHLFDSTGEQVPVGHTLDQDAIAALKSLGYDTSTILHALKGLPKEITSTEARVTAALRNI